MKISINVSKKDYLDFNIFVMFKSKEGKKQILLYRIAIFLLFVGFACFVVAGKELSVGTFIGIIPHLILLVLFQALLKPFMVWIVKGNIKSLSKSGKLLYSEYSEMEFCDDVFTEITADNKTEQKYSAIEEVDIIRGQAIYIRLNRLLAYIIPESCLESSEKYEELLKLLREKCSVVNEF